MDLKGRLFDISLPLFQIEWANYEKGILHSTLNRRVLVGIVLQFFGLERLNLRKKTLLEAYFLKLSCNCIAY
jgi:hypothetical protein